MKIQNININNVKPYEKNTKKHPKQQIDNICESLKQFGWQQPIVVDKDNVIIVGHGRYFASLKLGYDTVPCVVADNLTPEQVKKYRLLDNKLNESEWDYDFLLGEIDGLSFDGFNVDWDIPEQADDSVEVVEVDVPDIPEETDVKLGDIYQLGNHRLMCGDSTSEEDVAKLMDGVKADMVFTDPPYNLETKGGCKGEIGKALRKQGKEIDFISKFEPTDFLNILPTIFNHNTLNAYIFCNKELLPQYLNWAVENKYSYNVLVWKKPSAIPIGDSHRPDIEYLLLFRKNAIWNNGIKNANYSRCLEFSRETGLHPTMKPISLITNEMLISSNKNSNVVDLFGGSGSTLIACEQLNRKCYMMELDSHYCGVIIKRWEDFTNKKAIKIGG